jgi:Uma2 family endonuclease
MYHSLMAGKDTMPTSARAQARLTYQDFLRIPDDGKRHEIIDGVHYVTPSPNLRHQQLSGRLHYAIEHYLRRHPGVGEVFYAPFDVVLSNWDVVEPDLLLVLSDQRTILTEQNVQGAPALVIEILSPTTRRRVLAGRSTRPLGRDLPSHREGRVHSQRDVARRRIVHAHNAAPAGFLSQRLAVLRLSAPSCRLQLRAEITGIKEIPGSLVNYLLPDLPELPVKILPDLPDLPDLLVISP